MQRVAITPSLLAAVTVDPGEVDAADTLDVDLTVAQSLPEQFFFVQATEDLEAGLVIGAAWCATPGTVTFRLANVTATPIDPAEQVFNVMAF